MTRTAQLPLFGAQSVHIGRYAPVPSQRTCAVCRVLLAVADVMDPCGVCPGLVEPVPSWMVLEAVETPEPESLGRAA